MPTAVMEHVRALSIVSVAIFHQDKIIFHCRAYNRLEVFFIKMLSGLGFSKLLEPRP